MILQLNPTWRSVSARDRSFIEQRRSLPPGERCDFQRDRQGQAHKRARARNKKVGDGAGRFRPNLSDAPKEKKRNAAHRNSVPQRDHRVPECAADPFDGAAAEPGWSQAIAGRLRPNLCNGGRSGGTYAPPPSGYSPPAGEGAVRPRSVGQNSPAHSPSRRRDRAWTQAIAVR
jgi:hypothetical protein